ncbi:unnamed protein product [Cunninghamella blakesleeana]
MKGGEINKLPYDVIIYFLQLPMIDIDTILQFIQALPQYRSLGYYVLKQYKLPNIYLQAITDQEGKRQYKTQFQFHCLNHRDIDYVTFIVNPKNNHDLNKKRYISNLSKAARPQLKNITLHHSSSSSSTSLSTMINNHPHTNNQLILERNKSMVSTLSTSTSSSSPSFSSCDHDHDQPSMKKKDTTFLSQNLIQSHSLSLKYGLHTIYPQHYKKSSMKWQYIYHVSYTDETIDPWLFYSPDQFSHDQNKKKEKKKKSDEKTKRNDMNLSPLCIIVPLTLLTKNNSLTSSFINTTHHDSSHPFTHSTHPSLHVKSIHQPFWYSKCLKVMKKCIPQV